MASKAKKGAAANAAPDDPRPEVSRMDAPRPDGLDAVAAAVLDAEGENRLEGLGLEDPPPGQAIAGEKPGEWKPDASGLPPDCPVLPLGTESGLFFFLDTIGQLRVLKDSEMGQAGINSLFMGRHWWLYWAFPKKNADGIVTSWRPEKAREVLMLACARKGAWNSADRVRGRGIWKGKDGRLILHCGDRLFSSRGEEPLGELEGMVYPTRPPIPRPWPKTLEGKPGPMLSFFPHLKTWNWRRPELDPVLMAGFIAVGFLSGALDWRPAAFLQGGKGTGKSSLQRDTRGLFGHAMIRSGDATKAGLSQKLKFDCIAVALDEFESSADNRRKKEILDLMRMSASGDDILRGGDNHKGSEFTGRSPFLFSTINTPPLDPQDLSRLAILCLKKLVPGQVKREISEDDLAQMGRKMLRRLVDNWHRWKPTLDAWREFLGSCGHDARGQDTFGTLMAAADILIADDAAALDLAIGPNAEDFEYWRPFLTASALTEFDQQEDNWRACLSHIMSQRIEAWRGGTRHTVGQVLTEFFETDINFPGRLDYEQSRALLEQTGLSLRHPKLTGRPQFELFIPGQHPLLHELMRGTKWQGDHGAGTWQGALRQAEDATGRDLWIDCSARIDGRKAKGTAFALIDIIAEKDKEDGG